MLLYMFSFLSHAKSHLLDVFVLNRAQHETILSPIGTILRPIGAILTPIGDDFEPIGDQRRKKC